MNYQKPDKKIITSWRIGRFIGMIIFMGIFGISRLILGSMDFFTDFVVLANIIIGILYLYLIVSFIIFPNFEYRQLSYLITDDRVEIRHGIFFINTSIIPVIRIQHVTITQGPINRKFQLSTVEIHTASGVFKIEGLNNDTANQITDSLKSRLYKRLENI